jgi:hypothetical protein
MGWIHLVLLLVLLNIYEICLKLKYGFKIIHKFPTFQKPYYCIDSILAMVGPLDTTKPERFDDCENLCGKTKLRFGICQ